MQSPRVLVASMPMRAASALHLRGEFFMSRMNSKRKRRSKAVPVLGAAGLSLTIASEGSLATRRRRWILRVFGRASRIRKQCLFAPGTASD